MNSIGNVVRGWPGRLLVVTSVWARQITDVWVDGLANYWWWLVCGWITGAGPACYCLGGWTGRLITGAGLACYCLHGWAGRLLVLAWPVIVWVGGPADYWCWPGLLLSAWVARQIIGGGPAFYCLGEWTNRLLMLTGIWVGGIWWICSFIYSLIHSLVCSHDFTCMATIHRHIKAKSLARSCLLLRVHMSWTWQCINSNMWWSLL